MGARTLLGLCALLSLGLKSLAASTYDLPDIDLVSFTANKAQQIKGRNILLTAVIDINNLGTNDEVFCGFQNENFDTVKTAIGAAGIRFKQQRTKENAKWYIKEVRESEGVKWEWTPRGYAIAQGRRYTMRANVKVAPDTVPNEYTWRFACTTELDTYGQPDADAFEKFLNIPLMAGSGKSRRSR